MEAVPIIQILSMIQLLQLPAEFPMIILFGGLAIQLNDDHHRLVGQCDQRTAGRFEVPNSAHLLEHIQIQPSRLLDIFMASFLSRKRGKSHETPSQPLFVGTVDLFAYRRMADFIFQHVASPHL